MTDKNNATETKITGQEKNPDEFSGLLKEAYKAYKAGDINKALSILSEKELQKNEQRIREKQLVQEKEIKKLRRLRKNMLELQSSIEHL